MTREKRIVEAFVDLANTLVDEFDVLELLHRVAEHSIQLIDCDEAGLLLADASGALRVMASSSERADALELLQCQNAEGPCFECVERSAPVVSEDLAADGARWPTFAPAAMDRGFRSVHALPMRVRGQTIGALNLFRTHTGSLPDHDVRLGQGMADIAAVALIQERTLRDAQDVVQSLQGALTSRVVIEQAKGILAERAGVDVELAFTRLRNYARQHNRRLGDVARDVIDKRVDIAELADRGLRP